MNLVDWCNRVIKFGFYLLFILVPLILTPWNYELFEYNKMMVTYGLTVVIVSAWIIKMLAQKEIRIAKTPLDIPIVLFLSSQLVSSLFSMDPHVSWFGYYSRFNGGMLSIISYVLLYYAFISNYSLLSTLYSLLKVALGTSVAISIYGVAERLGIDKTVWVQDVQNRVFSTLGQPNWLAAYLVALIPIASGFALRTQIPELKSQQGKNIFNWSLSSVFWVLSSVLFFIVLLLTRSRSGLLGFAVADAVFWGLLALKTVFHKDSLFAKRLAFPFLFLHATFFLIVFFNGSYVESVDRWLTLNAWKNRLSQSSSLPISPSPTPASYTAPLLEFGGTESGTIRKYVWQGAIAAWKSSAKTFLIGTGTETFAFAFYQFRPSGHNMTSEWDFLYNKAHNEYLNYLATTGIFGLGSYLLFIGAFVWWFVKQISNFKFLISKQIPNSKSQLGQLEIRSIEFVLPALFAGWTSVLVTNFFGFSVVIVQLFLFLFPAMMIVLSRKSDEEAPSRKLSLDLADQAGQWISFAVVFGTVVLLIILVRTWWADVLFAQGYQFSRSSQYVKAQPPLQQAITINPTEPLYRDEYSTVLAALTVSAVEQKQATLAGTFAKQALAESDRAVAISPKNVNFWKSRTKVFYSFSTFDPDFNPAAITALSRAGELSPNDPKIIYNLAILYGRQNDNTRAIELLQKAIELKPNYRDAYFALHLFYKEIGNGQKAAEIVETYLQKVDPNDKDFQGRLNQ